MILPSAFQQDRVRAGASAARAASEHPGYQADLSGIDKGFGAAWAGLVPRLDQWRTVTEGRGPSAVQEAYLDTLNRRVAPNLGHILSISE